MAERAPMSMPLSFLSILILSTILVIPFSFPSSVSQPLSLPSSPCPCISSSPVLESLSSHIFIKPHELIHIQTALDQINRQHVELNNRQYPPMSSRNLSASSSSPLSPSSTSSSSSSSSSSNISAISRRLFNCSLCNVSCHDEVSLQRHLQSKKHIKQRRTHVSSTTLADITNTQVQQALSRPSRSSQTAVNRLTGYIHGIYGSWSKETVEIMWYQYQHRPLDRQEQNAFANTILRHPSNVRDQEQWAMVLMRTTIILPHLIDRARHQLALSSSNDHHNISSNLNDHDRWHLRYQCVFRIFYSICSYLQRYIGLMDHITRICLSGDIDNELLSDSKTASFKVAQIGEEIFGHARDPRSHIHPLIHPASSNHHHHGHNSNHIINHNPTVGPRPRSNSLPCLPVSLSSSPCSCISSSPVLESLSSHIFIKSHELIHIQTALDQINRQHAELNNQQISENDTYADDDQDEDLIDEWDDYDLDHDEYHDDA